MTYIMYKNYLLDKMYSYTNINILFEIYDYSYIYIGPLEKIYLLIHLMKIIH